MGKKNKAIKRIPLLETHKELLAIKLQKLNQILEIVKNNKRELDLTCNRVAAELGVPDEEFNQWDISEDLNFLEKTGQRPTLRIPPLKPEKNQSQEDKKKD